MPNILTAFSREHASTTVWYSNYAAILCCFFHLLHRDAGVGEAVLLHCAISYLLTTISARRNHNFQNLILPSPYSIYSPNFTKTTILTFLVTLLNNQKSAFQY